MSEGRPAAQLGWLEKEPASRHRALTCGQAAEGILEGATSPPAPLPSTMSALGTVDVLRHKEVSR